MTSTQLFHVQEKGKTCISLIISLQNVLPGSEAVDAQIKTVIEKTRSLLEVMCPLKETQKVMKILEQMQGNIGYECNLQGIGIYVTPAGPGTLVQFPFPVKNKIHIGESFWIRELLYLNYYAVEYYVLKLSQKVIRLFKGKLNNISEVNDSRFPHVLAIKQMIAPVLNYSINDEIIEKNKPVRVKTFLPEIDNKLVRYLSEYPLIIAGSEKQILQFNEITNHWTHIVGNITGNLEKEQLCVLAENVWPKIREWLDRRKEVLANEWLGKRALRKICNIRDIWQAAVEGRGKILLVERDYSLSAFQDTADGSIHLKPPHATIRIISDVVDEMMKIVLAGKGEVIILENGALPNYQHMVLLTE